MEKEINLFSANVLGMEKILADLFSGMKEHNIKCANESGISTSQLQCLFSIYRKDKLKMSDLAEEMFLSPASITNLITKLENAELVIRTESKDNRRVIFVDITEKGRLLIEKIRKNYLSKISSFLEVLPEMQIDNIKEGTMLLSKYFKS